MKTNTKESTRISMKTARMLAGMTEDEACTAMNIKKSQLIAWETGNAIPSIEHGIAMSKTYGIPLDDISFQKKDNSVKYDTSALRTRSLSKYNALEDFAAAVKMKPSTLKSRMDGKTEFNIDEIKRICAVLDVRTEEEITRLFLTKSSDIQLKKLEEQFLSMDEDQRTLMLDIMDLVSGRPDRREFALNYTGKIKDLPAALAQI